MLRESSQWPQRLAARLLERSDARRLSVARVLVAALVTYCLMVTGITALALGAGLLPSRRPPESRGAGGASAGPGERSRAVSRGSGSAKAAGRNDQSRGGSAVGAGLRSAGSTGGSSPAGGRAPDSQRAGAPESDAGSEAERSWEVVCGPLPSYGAPEWAKAQIDALYLGGMRLHAEPAPGAAGGCTQRAVVPWYAHEGLVYTVGRDRHNEIRSTAVDSRRFGPAIFLAPAAQIVLRLLEEEAGPVGGTPRIFVENGDFLSVETERGTFILVRPEEHMRGRPRWAYPYTELPPAVAKAWTIAMWSWHRWLWPYRHERAGRTTFALALSPITRIAVDSIEYETAGHTATYRGVSYSGTEARFSERELREYAELARWHRP